MFIFKVGNREFSLSSEVNDLEERLGLESNFCFNLIHENDWSFSIKSAALVEAAVNQLLKDRISVSGINATKPKVDTWIERHSLGGMTGKLSFIKAAGLLPRNSIKSAENINRIRNAYAHKINTVSLSLKEIYDELGGEVKFEVFEKMCETHDIEDVRQENGILKMSIGLEMLSFLAWANFNQRPPSLFDFLEQKTDRIED